MRISVDITQKGAYFTTVPTEEAPMFETVAQTESRVPGADYSRVLKGWTTEVFHAVMWRAIGFPVGFAIVAAILKGVA